MSRTVEPLTLEIGFGVYLKNRPFPPPSSYRPLSLAAGFYPAGLEGNSAAHPKTRGVRHGIFTFRRS